MMLSSNSIRVFDETRNQEPSEPSAQEAELFLRCRLVLGLSHQSIARALNVGSDRTVRRWEACERDIPGPVWVALKFMLRDAGHALLANHIERFAT